MKKILFVIFFFFLSNITVAAKEKINIYFFTGSGCEYCNEALIYLHDHIEKYENYVDVKVYEVWHNENNSKLLNDLKKEGIDAHTIPFVLIGEKYVQNGYNVGEGSVILKEAYKQSSNQNYKDIVAPLLENNPKAVAYTLEEALEIEGIISQNSVTEYLIIASIIVIIVIIGIIFVRKLFC